MIVLNKKRMLIILSSVFLLIFAFMLTTGREEDSSSIISTVSLPVSGKTVVIDAGHGIPDEGAQSSNGTTEAKTNLKIALKLQNLLEQSGCTVILTRSDENAIYDLFK